MTLVDRTDPSQTDAIAFEIELAHAPAKIWRALTDPDLLTQWLLPTVGHRLQPGAEFQFRTQPQPGWDGVVNCRYLEIEPEKKISWAWVVGDIDTVVTITMHPVASGTRLDIVQSGFRPDQKQNFGGARYGWKMMGTKLIDVLGTLA